MGKKLTSNEVLGMIQDRTGLPKGDIVSVLRAVGNILDYALEEGHSVHIPHVGTFKYRKLPAQSNRRIGSNIYDIPERKEIKYRKVIKIED